MKFNASHIEALRQPFIDPGLLGPVFALQNPSKNRNTNDYTIEVITALAPSGCTVIRNRGNLLIRKGAVGKPKPFFLAHMDQVHDYSPPALQLQLAVAADKDTSLFAMDYSGQKQVGVGGDDKCGVYLALLMLHRLPECAAVFVRDEEVGCIGSGIVPLQWFADAAFVIQADRNNRTYDVIRDTNGMTCASDEFLAAILGLPTAVAFGHKENSGSITDIGELASRQLGVSMVNISSGYHAPHTDKEWVSLTQLNACCSLAFEAAENLGHKVWTHTPTNLWAGGYDSSYFGRKSLTKWWVDKVDRAPKESGWFMENIRKLLDKAANVPIGSYFGTTPTRDIIIAELETLGYDRDKDSLDALFYVDLKELRDSIRSYRELTKAEAEAELTGEEAEAEAVVLSEEQAIDLAERLIETGFFYEEDLEDLLSKPDDELIELVNLYGA